VLKKQKNKHISQIVLADTVLPLFLVIYTFAIFFQVCFTDRGHNGPNTVI